MQSTPYENMIKFLTILNGLMKKGCYIKYLTNQIIFIDPEKQKVHTGDSTILMVYDFSDLSTDYLKKHIHVYQEIVMDWSQYE